MKQNRFISLVALSGVLSGCAGLYEKQAPAPVYGKPAPVYPQKQKAPTRPVTPAPAPSSEPEPIVKTTPIQEFNQPLTPIAPTPIPGTSPVMPGSSGAFPLFPGAEAPLGTDSVPQQPAPGQVQDQQPTAATSAPQPEAQPFEPAPTPFQPIEPPSSASPAVGALVIAANKSSQSGELDSAVSTIERARSIEPGNAGLYYRLALLRLKQSKPKMAEELAKKAALLASGDRELKKHSWLLIAHAREMQKDYKGAKAARDKAAGF